MARKTITNSASISDKCSIIVSSCDAYEFLWNAFFKCFKAAWPECECKIYLNTESKQIKSELFDVNVCNITGTGIDKKDWSSRLKNALSQVESEYVICLLDDFFMDGKVDVKRIEKCIEWMDADGSISNICFMETYEHNRIDKKHPGFFRRERFGEYKFNCQAGLWRREHLIEYLRAGESPWDFEVNGNYRSWMKYPRRKFLSLDPKSGDVFPYLLTVGKRRLGGAALIGGKWYKSYVEELNKKYGLGLDFSGRDYVDEAKLIEGINNYDVKEKEPLIKLIFWPIVYLRRKIRWMKNIWEKREYWMN